MNLKGSGTVASWLPVNIALVASIAGRLFRKTVIGPSSNA